jgi:Uncharacterized conserved protein
MEQIFQIKKDKDFVTLGQVLKMEAIIYSGGAAKIFLEDNEILINNERELRRGRKLYPGDKISFADISIMIEGA